MGNVAKRPDGRYRARYRDPSGLEHARHFDKKRDADRWLTSIGADLDRGEYVDPRGGRTLFAERYQFWFATTVNLRESTRARDDSYGRNLILPTFEHRKLSSIDHDSIQRWMAELGREGYAPATVVKAHQILSKVLRSAVRARLIPTNPCADSELPKIERNEQRFLSAEEVAQLAETINPHYRVMVLVAAYSGLRLGELAGLRRRRVDLEGGNIDVAEICIHVRGRTSFGPPKTKASRRRVPIPDYVVEELAEHVAGMKADDLAFTSLDGRSPIRSSNFHRRIWQPACVEAGFGEMVDNDTKTGRGYVGLRPHDLRHTAVALWIAGGASPKEIAARAGHTSVSTVLDRYGHLGSGSEKALNDALDKMARRAARLKMAQF